MKLSAMVARHLRVLFRSKTMLIVIMAAPLLAVLLAAISFDNYNQYALKVAVYGESYPSMINQFFDDLEKGNIRIDRLKTDGACRDSVRQGRHHACMIVEPDSRKQVAITMLVDFSKVNLVDHLLNQVSDRVALKSSEISLNLTEALVRRIEMTREEVDKNRYIITSLTTGQELVGRQLDELNAALAGFEPRADISAAQGLVTAIDGGEVAADIDSIKRLKDDLVYQLSRISKEIDEALKDTALAESDKNKLRMIISQNDDKVRKISDEFRASAELTQKDLDSLRDRLVSVIGSLKKLQDDIDLAKDTKFDANVQIRKLKGTLDDNLIKIVVLQSAFNKIGETVENIKVSSESMKSPIRTDIQPISESGSRLNMIFPTLLVFLMMVTCTLISASLVAAHRRNPGAARDEMMPIHPAMRLAALFLAVLLVAAAQTVAVMAFAGAILGPSLIPGILPSLPVMLAIISVFGLLGMALGFAFATEQGAVIAGVALTSASLVFSDLLLPIEGMPPLAASFASINPFVVGSDLVKRALIYHAGLPSIFSGTALLAVYALGLCVILLLMHRDRF